MILQPMVQQVPTVMVSPGQVRQIALTHPNRTVITAKQIRDSGATHIAQVLASQSSIQVEDLTGDGSQVTVSMRGFGDNAASNTLIMINGVPQNDPDIASSNLNQIPIQDVKEIDILQGSHSVLYGDQAVAGVINIITKQPTKSEAHLSVGYGSYHHQRYYASIGNAYKNGLSYRLSLNRDTTDNYREHNNDNQNNANLDLDYHYKQGRLHFLYDAYFQRLLYAGALSLAQLEQNRRQAEPSMLGEAEQNQQQHANLLWKRFLGQDWVSNSNIDYRYYTATGTFRQFRQVLNINPQFIGIIGKNQLLLAAQAQYDHYSMNSNAINDEEHQATASLYSQWQRDLFKRIRITVAGRLAGVQSQSSGSLYNGSYDDAAAVSDLSLLWRCADNLSLGITRAGNYRFPKAEENATILPNTSHLKTQTGASYDLVLRWFVSHYQLHTDLYYMTLNNEIVFDPTPVGVQKFGTNRNLPPTSRSGVNISVSDQISRVIGIFAQYSYVNALIRSGNFKGNAIPFVAANALHLSTHLNFEPHWSIFSEGMFTGKRFAAGDDANTAAVVNSQWLFNAAIRYRYKRWLATLRVNNLFNKLYNAYVSTTTHNVEAYYPAPGRNVMFTLECRLW